MQEKSTFLRSSIRGEIRWIVLYFDGDDVSVWHSLLKSLLLSMPIKVKFLIGCSEQAHVDILWKSRATWANNKRVKKTKLGQILKGAKCFLHGVPQIEAFMNIWSRDPFFFKSGNGNPDIIYISKTGYANSLDFQRFNLDLFDFSSIRIEKPEGNNVGEALYLSGGNLLADDNFLLVGYPEFQRTWNSAHAPNSTFRNTLLNEHVALETLLDWANGEKSQLFCKVHLLSKYIPLPKPSSMLGDKMFKHIDGYISLTGSHTIDQNGRKKYVLLVAQIECILLPPKAEKTDWEGILAEWCAYLDAVAQELEDIGDFDVWRNPVPMFALCDWDWDKARPHPIRPYLGLMNNVLTEVTKSTKKVWLSALTPAPYLTEATEKLSTIEQVNIALWASLGFEVRIIHANFHPFWKWLGGLRCLTNHF